jgi:hypothetical protein
MPVTIDDMQITPEPDRDEPPSDPDAPQEWTATRWDEGGGVATDNKGNQVIFQPSGTVVTSTPSGQSMTRPDGSGTEYNTDFENPEESFDRSWPADEPGPSDPERLLGAD